MPTTISINDEIQRQLKDEADRTGKPQDELVTEALTQYLTKVSRSFSSLGAGDDPTLDARRTHQLLEQTWGKR